MTRAPELTACALALALSGCSDPPPPPNPCAVRIAALRESLERAALAIEPPGAPTWVSLPTLEDGAGAGALGAATPLLVITAEDVELAGRGVGGDGDPAMLAETLASDLERIVGAPDEDEETTGTREPRLVALWLDPETPLGRVAEVLRSAPPWVRFAVLVRGAQLPTSAPAPAWVTEALGTVEGARPRERRQRAGRAWARATRRCPSARGTLPDPAAVDPAGPALGRTSVAGLLAAVERCGCARLDVDAIEALASASLVPPSGPVLRLAPTFRFGAARDQATELQFRDEDPVSQLVRRAPTREGEVWVRVD
ncbi:MAG: hypothetical protein AB7S26_26100 [Sandaracinaceae bacterium]